MEWSIGVESNFGVEEILTKPSYSVNLTLSNI